MKEYISTYIKNKALTRAGTALKLSISQCPNSLNSDPLPRCIRHKLVVARPRCSHLKIKTNQS